MFLFLLIIASISAVLELEMSAPSFVDIAKFYNASEGAMGLTISLNVIAFAIASFFYGPLTETYGRKKILIIGNIIMSIGAIGCVISPSINFLLLSRFIQGLGAASSAVIIPIIASDFYKPEQSGKIFNIILGCTTTFTAIAPLIGGFVNYNLGWRWNYGVIALISMTVTALLFLLKETKKTPKILLSPSKILKEYSQVLSSSKFLVSSTLCNLLYGSYVAFVAYAPFLYMKSFGLNDVKYSIHQGVIICIFAISNFLIGYIKGPKITEKVLLPIGSFMIFASGAILMISKTAIVSTVGASISAIGNAIIFPIVFSYMMRIMPNLNGAVSSLNVASRSIIFSVLVSLATFLYDGSSLKIGLIIFVIAISVIWMLFFLKNNKFFENK